MIKRVAKIFFSLLFVWSCGTAQPISDGGTQNKKALKKFNEALAGIDTKKPVELIKMLDDAIEKDPQFIDAYMLKAGILAENKKYDDAISVFEKVLTINPDYAMAYYRLGETQSELGNFEKTRAVLEKFLAYPKNPEARINVAKRLLAKANFAINAMKNPVKFEPENLGPNINTQYKDYFPSFTVDGKQMIFDRNVNGNEEFYISQVDGKTFTPGKLLPAPMNSNQRQSYPSFTADGKFVFFARFTAGGGENCDIWFSHFNGSVWESPTNLQGPINTLAWESQPCISADGRTLYFLSNRKGSIGYSDIYVSKFGEKGWSVPENLGPGINSVGEEEAPFIHPDGKTLYFSSSGRIGMGENDIFMSRLSKDGKWGEAVNMGYPLNSTKDERCMIVAANGIDAYITTDNLKGYGDWDIYKFTLDPAYRPQQVTYVKGTIVDDKTSKPLGALIEVFDLYTKESYYISRSNSSNGQFFACLPTGSSYMFKVQGEGYLFYTENYSFPNSNSVQKPEQLSIRLQKLEIGSSLRLNNVFFETDKFDLKPESFTELNLVVDLLKKNPKVKVELGGHTDSIGSKQLNKTLSASRAKAVYDYLVGKGIPATQLTHKGYGDTVPFTSNKTEEGRKMNRRTEMKIVAI
ncbi:MAG: OmpA family protein [Bacteroidota bacterium]|nr:OmpA family protein [Bacteroidota bacterium]